MKSNQKYFLILRQNGAFLMHAAKNALKIGKNRNFCDHRKTRDLCLVF